jgi:DNA uptake protein ComE-like DNA-binding protein
MLDRFKTNLGTSFRIVVVVKLITPFAAILLVLVTGCTSQKPSPDELREKAAQATSDIRRDAKAMADGVKEGWNRNQPLDINKATKQQLVSLPGMSTEGAERIIDGRPYSTSAELVSRHVISQLEYDKIKDQITTRN